MRKRPREQAWKIVMTAIAVTATVMALYVQLFGLRLHQEEARRTAARLEERLAAARARLKAEILAELRAEIEQGTSTDSEPQPLPDAVLRRLDSDAVTLGQFVDPSKPETAVTVLNEGIASLAEQVEESDRALRRDFEESRALVRRELDTLRRATSLILIALIPLILQLLAALWPHREAEEGT